MNKTQIRMLVLFGIAVALYLILVPPSDADNFYTV